MVATLAMVIGELRNWFNMSRELLRGLFAIRGLISWGATTTAFLFLLSVSCFAQTENVQGPTTTQPVLTSEVSPSPNISPSPSPSPTATPEPVATPEDANPAPPPQVRYFFSDFPPNKTSWKSKYIDLSIAFALLADYTFVGQDATSRSQVGPQASIGDLRAGRFVFYGQFKTKRPIGYFVAADFNEIRTPGQRFFTWLDMYLIFRLWGNARLTVGKQKEPFIYEMVGDAANLPQQERFLNPFFNTRNVGIKYMQNFADDKLLLQIGVYNDWFLTDFKKSGTQVSGRLSGLPYYSKDGREYLHLAVGLRYNQADDGVMRFRGRPENNKIDYYVDTGTFPAKYAKQISLEALYNRKGFSILAEYTHAEVESKEMQNPGFSGFYTTASYVLSGENRPYDKRVGYARRIIPKSRFGAVELVGRFGYLEMEDTLIKGGRMAKWYGGANYWASKTWKFGIGYGLARLDRFDTIGWTQYFITRVQWIY